MAKLRDSKIGKADISEYLSQYSDFSFEVQVLSKLNSLGFTCQRSGTYEDQNTGKTREFDIRATRDFPLASNLIFRLCLSVECKNLRDNFPLVVHCMPRSPSESSIDLVCSSSPKDYSRPFLEFSARAVLEGEKCIYKIQDPVGKSCDQVGRRDSQDGAIIGNDADVFDKISQAINASYDLIRHCHYAGKAENTVISVVVPVLVVPNDRIWSVWYSANGNLEKEPFQTPHVSYYIDKSWLIGNDNERKQRYHLSHMEIVQIDFLPQLFAGHLQTEVFTTAIKPRG